MGCNNCENCECGVEPMRLKLFDELMMIAGDPDRVEVDTATYRATVVALERAIEHATDEESQKWTAIRERDEARADAYEKVQALAAVSGILAGQDVPPTWDLYGAVQDARAIGGVCSGRVFGPSVMEETCSTCHQMRDESPYCSDAFHMEVK